MAKTVTNVISPSTPNLPLEEWVLLSAFVPVNCRHLKCNIRINRNTKDMDRIIRSKMQNHLSSKTNYIIQTLNLQETTTTTGCSCSFKFIYIMIWCFIHDKFPSDGQLWHRYCILVFMCSLCGSHKTSDHMFFQCNFTSRIWSWLGHCAGLEFWDWYFLYFPLLAICDRNWISHVLLAAITNTIWAVRYCRNQLRFK